MRNRNSGLTSSRSIACRMPRSNPPSLRAPFVEAQQRRDIGARHRTPNARRASVERIRSAQAASSRLGTSAGGRRRRSSRQVTDEDAAAARRVTRSHDLVRTADRDVRQRGGLDAAATPIRNDQRLDRRVGLRQEGRADLVGTGLHRKLRLQPARAAAPALPRSRTRGSLLLGEQVHALRRRWSTRARTARTMYSDRRRRPWRPAARRCTRPSTGKVRWMRTPPRVPNGSSSKWTS